MTNTQRDIEILNRLTDNDPMHAIARMRLCAAYCPVPSIDKNDRPINPMRAVHADGCTYSSSRSWL